MPGHKLLPPGDTPWVVPRRQDLAPRGMEQVGKAADGKLQAWGGAVPPPGLPSPAPPPSRQHQELGTAALWHRWQQQHNQAKARGPWHPVLQAWCPAQGGQLREMLPGTHSGAPGAPSPLLLVLLWSFGAEPGSEQVAQGVKPAPAPTPVLGEGSSVPSVGPPVPRGPEIW